MGRGGARARLGLGELSTLRPPLAGYARGRFAQLRRRQGRREDARALLAQAGAHVLVPLVQAELALDEGDPSAALGHAERYLRGLGGEGSIESAAALELLVAIAVRPWATCASAHESRARLATIAQAVGTGALRAAERRRGGRAAAADGDLGTARRAFEDAIDLYARSAAPFEGAQRAARARSCARRRRPCGGRRRARAARPGRRSTGLGAGPAAAGAGELVALLARRTAASSARG